MTFFDDCETWFQSRNLYEILGIEKTANKTEIKKAYHKLSLKTHPDRVAAEEKENATLKFQILGKIYSVLSNKDKRGEYDDFGTIADDDFNENIDNWIAYWRQLFPKITTQALDDFTDRYWGSDKEKEDLKKYYLEFKGDMNKIIRNMYCRPLEHEENYKNIINEWIENDDVPAFKAFTEETKARANARRRKYKKEKEEAENDAAMRDLSCSVGDSKDALEKIISRRTKERCQMQDDFFANLEAKYVKKTKKKNENTKTTSKRRKTKS